MSRHWRPERADWTVIDGYGRAPSKSRGGAAVLVLGALFAGLAGGVGWQWWNARPVESGPATSPIEWNAVQAVPTRTPDAEDVAWERRAQVQPSPSWGGLGGGEQTISSAADAAGPPPLSSPTRGEALTGTIFVIDGDTFSLNRRRIRILGMDAPETHPSRCLQEAQLGNAATDKLRALLSSGTITMSGSGVDRYGRDLRQVFVNGVDVADSMISAGLARSYGGGRKQSWC